MCQRRQSSRDKGDSGNTRDKQAKKGHARDSTREAAAVGFVVNTVLHLLRRQKSIFEQECSYICVECTSADL